MTQQVVDIIGMGESLEQLVDHAIFVPASPVKGHIVWLEEFGQHAPFTMNLDTYAIGQDKEQLIIAVVQGHVNPGKAKTTNGYYEGGMITRFFYYMDEVEVKITPSNGSFVRYKAAPESVNTQRTITEGGSVEIEVGASKEGPTTSAKLQYSYQQSFTAADWSIAETSDADSVSWKWTCTRKEAPTSSAGSALPIHSCAVLRSTNIMRDWVEVSVNISVTMSEYIQDTFSPDKIERKPANFALSTSLDMSKAAL